MWITRRVSHWILAPYSRHWKQLVKRLSLEWVLAQQERRGPWCGFSMEVRRRAVGDEVGEGWAGHGFGLSMTGRVQVLFQDFVGGQQWNWETSKEAIAVRSDSGLGRDRNSCYGLNYVLWKICWNPNPWYLWMWPYLELGSLLMYSC